MTDLGTLGGDHTTAVAINARGQVVGRSSMARPLDEFHAVLWQDGTMTDLGTLGGDFTTAVAINARGQVLGNSETASGEARAVLWTVDVVLDGVDNYQGSTSITGLGYMLYGGEHRKERAGALMESWNMPDLRNERGRWRQRLTLKFMYEDLRQPESRVTLNAARPEAPEVRYTGRSAYVERGLRALESQLPSILEALPVKSYQTTVSGGGSENHILGTTVMGPDPREHVVDGGLVHHRVRNLIVLGGGVFPTIAPANPTLTISALSLRAADRLTASR
jgi:probable HAF family extracellular repeat protein